MNIFHIYCTKAHLCSIFKSICFYFLEQFLFQEQLFLLSSEFFFFSRADILIFKSNSGGWLRLSRAIFFFKSKCFFSPKQLFLFAKAVIFILRAIILYIFYVQLLFSRVLFFTFQEKLRLSITSEPKVTLAWLGRMLDMTSFPMGYCTYICSILKSFSWHTLTSCHISSLYHHRPQSPQIFPLICRHRFDMIPHLFHRRGQHSPGLGECLTWPRFQWVILPIFVQYLNTFSWHTLTECYKSSLYHHSHNPHKYFPYLPSPLDTIPHLFHRRGQHSPADIYRSSRRIAGRMYRHVDRRWSGRRLAGNLCLRTLRHSYTGNHYHSEEKEK